MIRVHRGVEPAALKRLRTHKYNEAVAAGFTGDKPPSVTWQAWQGSSIRKIKEQLFLAQNKKCAYCGCRLTEPHGLPVDHHRPKDGALRSDGTKDVSHYWWLAWTWENLLVSCSTCNSQGRKGNHFPLVPRTAACGLPRIHRGKMELPDLNKERPLLLDPGDPSTDPLDHIGWRPRDQTPPWAKWSWLPHGQTPQGRQTIETLHLDGALAERVSDHVRQNVVPAVGWARGSGRDSKKVWKAVCALALPNAEHAGAVWWVLGFLHQHLRLQTRGHALPPRP